MPSFTVAEIGAAAAALVSAGFFRRSRIGSREGNNASFYCVCELLKDKNLYDTAKTLKQARDEGVSLSPLLAALNAFVKELAYNIYAFSGDNDSKHNWNSAMIIAETPNGQGGFVIEPTLYDLLVRTFENNYYVDPQAFETAKGTEIDAFVSDLITTGFFPIQQNIDIGKRAIRDFVLTLLVDKNMKAWCRYADAILRFNASDLKLKNPTPKDIQAEYSPIILADATNIDTINGLIERLAYLYEGYSGIHDTKQNKNLATLLVRGDPVYQINDIDTRLTALCDLIELFL